MLRGASRLLAIVSRRRRPDLRIGISARPSFADQHGSSLWTPAFGRASYHRMNAAPSWPRRPGAALLGRPLLRPYLPILRVLGGDGRLRNPGLVSRRMLLGCTEGQARPPPLIGLAFGFRSIFSSFWCDGGCNSGSYSSAVWRGCDRNHGHLHRDTSARYG